MSTWMIAAGIYLLVAVVSVRPVARWWWREAGWRCEEFGYSRKHPCKRVEEKIGRDFVALRHGTCGRNDPKRVGAQALGMAACWPLVALGLAGYWSWQGVMWLVTKGITDGRPERVDQARIDDLERDLGIDRWDQARIDELTRDLGMDR